MGIASKVNDIIFEFMKKQKLQKTRKFIFNIQNEYHFVLILNSQQGFFILHF